MAADTPQGHHPILPADASHSFSDSCRSRARLTLCTHDTAKSMPTSTESQLSGSGPGGASIPGIHSPAASRGADGAFAFGLPPTARPNRAEQTPTPVRAPTTALEAHGTRSLGAGPCSAHRTRDLAGATATPSPSAFGFFKGFSKRRGGGHSRGPCKGKKEGRREREGEMSDLLSTLEVFRSAGRHEQPWSCSGMPQTTGGLRGPNQLRKQSKRRRT